MPLTTTARIAAFVIAFLALAGLAMQVQITSARLGSFGAGLWHELRFFTILTTAMVVAGFASLGLRGRALPAPWLGALTLWIAITGAVYHLMLAQQNAFSGIALWADHVQHSAVPILAVLWWLIFAPKVGLSWRHALVWLGWPLGYVAYALGRGAVDGVYAYPFIDVAALGSAGVARNAVGLTVAFFIGGLALVAIARLLTR